LPGTKPRTKIKSLYLKKLPSRPETIYSSGLLNINSIDLNDILDPFEEIFKSTTNQDEQPLPKKNQKSQKSHLSTEKLINAQIALAKSKKSNEEIYSDILNLNSQITDDDLNIYRRLDNSDDAIEAIDNWVNENRDCFNEKLDRVDQIVYSISKIPHYRQRIEYLGLNLRIGSRMEDNVNIIFEFLDAFENGKEKIHKILEVILAFSNFINFGTRQENMIAFQFNSILVLNEYRSSDNQMNLLNYIIRVLEKKYYYVLDWYYPFIRIDGESVYCNELEKYEEREMMVEKLRELVNIIGDTSSIQRLVEVENMMGKYHGLMERMNVYSYYEAESFEDFMKVLLTFAKLFDEAMRNNNQIMWTI